MNRWPILVLATTNLFEEYGRVEEDDSTLEVVDN